MIHTLSV